MERETILREFTHQAESFNASPTMRSDAALGRFVRMVPVGPIARWLDAACGPGLVSRELAPRVGHVHGVDVTPAMIEVARRETKAAGIANAEYSLGDATALTFDDGSFDGALTRFSLHHVPVPGRLVRELARVVRRGGVVAIADHVTAADTDAAAWHQEVERLRDPSHWACLTPARLRAVADEAGLSLVREEFWPLSLDFSEWLGRASVGRDAHALIEAALAERPGGVQTFRVETDADGGRRATLTILASIWRR